MADVSLNVVTQIVAAVLLNDQAHRGFSFFPNENNNDDDVDDTTNANQITNFTTNKSFANGNLRAFAACTIE